MKKYVFTIGPVPVNHYVCFCHHLIWHTLFFTYPAFTVLVVSDMNNFRTRTVVTTVLSVVII